MSEVLRLENVCKSFGHRPVVKNVSFAVGEGEIFGFLGPNGAGKTTTIKMVLGLLAADSGTILVNGHDIENDFEAAMSGISGIVENPDMYGYLSGYDNLMIQARACGADPRRIDEVVTLVGMQMRIKEKFKSYSLGMKQRLGVAQALLHNPKIMILDEPTNGLDPAGIQEMRELICDLPRRFGMTVVVSSHLLSEIDQMADHVGIIREGRLVFQDTLSALHARSCPRLALRTTDNAGAARLLGENRVPCTLEDGWLTLPLLSDADAASLSRFLASHRVDLLRMEERQKSLEDLFLELTGREESL